MILLFSFCECQWWIPWLIGPLLGLLAGWLLWAKYQKIAASLEHELGEMKTKNGNLQTDLELCRSSKAKVESDFALFRGQMREASASAAVKADPPKTSGQGLKSPAPKVAAAKKPKQDDLKLVEGIGPKIEKLLKADGIDSWRKLADASVEDIQAILDKAGKNYRLADPGTWPKQAGMCADGRWDDLKEYQDFLQGGR